MGKPQIFLLEWQRQEIMFVSYHKWDLSLAPAEVMKLNFRARDSQVFYLANFARLQTEERPLLVVGDTNSSD